MDRPRRELIEHVERKDNLTLLLIRQMQDQIPYSHILVSKVPSIDRTFACSRGAASVFPLYLYPTGDAAKQKSLFDVSPWPAGPDGRVPNLNPAFVAEVERRLGLVFRPHPPAPSPQEGRGSEENPPSPLTDDRREGLGGEVFTPGGPLLDKPTFCAYHTV